MIVAHEAQFGVRPTTITLPMPRSFNFLGVTVQFHTAPQHFTSDKERTYHHYFDSRMDIE